MRTSEMDPRNLAPPPIRLPIVSGELLGFTAPVASVVLTGSPSMYSVMVLPSYVPAMRCHPAERVRFARTLRVPSEVMIVSVGPGIEAQSPPL